MRITLLWFKSCTAPELAVSSWWLCQLSNLPQSESYSKIFKTPDKKLFKNYAIWIISKKDSKLKIDKKYPLKCAKCIILKSSSKLSIINHKKSNWKYIEKNKKTRDEKILQKLCNLDHVKKPFKTPNK